MVLWPRAKIFVNFKEFDLHLHEKSANPWANVGITAAFMAHCRGIP